MANEKQPKRKIDIFKILKTALWVFIIVAIVSLLTGIGSFVRKIKLPSWFPSLGLFDIFEKEEQVPQPDNSASDEASDLPVGEYDYIVTFYSFGSVYVIDGVQQIYGVTSGYAFGEDMPQSPTNEGYEFTGWYMETPAKMEFTSQTTVTADMNVYAEWKDLSCDHEPIGVEKIDKYGHTVVTWNCKLCDEQDIYSQQYVIHELQSEELSDESHTFLRWRCIKDGCSYYWDNKGCDWEETGTRIEDGHTVQELECKECGKTHEKIIHEYENGICTACGEDEPCQHTYKNYVCTKCGLKQMQNVFYSADGEVIDPDTGEVIDPGTGESGGSSSGSGDSGDTDPDTGEGGDSSSDGGDSGDTDPDTGEGGDSSSDGTDDSENESLTSSKGIFDDYYGNVYKNDGTSYKPECLLTSPTIVGVQSLGARLEYSLWNPNIVIYYGLYPLQAFATLTDSDGIANNEFLITLEIPAGTKTLFGCDKFKSVSYNDPYGLVSSFDVTYDAANGKERQFVEITLVTHVDLLTAYKEDNIELFKPIEIFSNIMNKDLLLDEDVQLEVLCDGESISADFALTKADLSVVGWNKFKLSLESTKDYAFSSIEFKITNGEHILDNTCNEGEFFQLSYYFVSDIVGQTLTDGGSITLVIEVTTAVQDVELADFNTNFVFPNGDGIVNDYRLRYFEINGLYVLWFEVSGKVSDIQLGCKTHEDVTSEAEVCFVERDQMISNGYDYTTGYLVFETRENFDSSHNDINDVLFTFIMLYV